MNNVCVLTIFLSLNNCVSPLTSNSNTVKTNNTKGSTRNTLCRVVRCPVDNQEVEAGDTAVGTGVAGTAVGMEAVGMAAVADKGMTAMGAAVLQNTASDSALDLRNSVVPRVSHTSPEEVPPGSRNMPYSVTNRYFYRVKNTRYRCGGLRDTKNIFNSGHSLC